MKLADAVECSLEESRFTFQTPILEDEEGPRWMFNYDGFKNDPTPDILLLGAYRHPNTGNNLVGGVNLHYVSDEQRDRTGRRRDWRRGPTDRGVSALERTETRCLTQLTFQARPTSASAFSRRLC